MRATPLRSGNIPTTGDHLRDAVGLVALEISRQLDWDRALSTVLRMTETAMAADAAAVWTLDLEAGSLRLTAHRGFPASELSAIQVVPLDAPLFTARAAREERIQVVERLADLPPENGAHNLGKRLGFGGLVSAPLRARGHLVGAITFLTRAPRQYSEPELAAVLSIADILGLGLENARLHTELERTISEVTTRLAGLQAVLQNAPSAIVTWAPDLQRKLRFTLANQAYCHAIGRNCDDVVGHLVAEVHPRLLAEDPEGMVTLWQALREAVTVRVPELPFRGPGGNLTYWRASYAPVRDNEGKVIAGIFVGEDITSEVHARRELEQLTTQLQTANSRLVETSMRAHDVAEEEQRRAAELDAIIENMNEGVVIADPQMQVRRVNRRELELLGLASREQYPRSFSDFLRFRPRTLEGRLLKTEDLPWARALRGETFSDLEMVIEAADGSERDLMLAGSPVRDPEGRVALTVTLARDVTALRRSEREREDYVRMISHDLRGPLTVIQGQAQILQRLADHPDAVQGSAAAVVAGAKRMNAMIQDLTDVARLEMGKLEPKLREVDLGEYLISYLAAVDPQERIRIRIEAPQPLPRALVDPDWLARILDNLLSNALKYSNAGTEVLVELGIRDGQLFCEVADRGRGIPPEELSKLFQRYYRGKSVAARREGLGLGLYITRLFTEAMGGRVWASSQIDVGSTFGFSLPMARQQPRK